MSRATLHFWRDQDLRRYAYKGAVRGRQVEAVPSWNLDRALRKFEYLDLATSVTDLKVPPSNRLHKLERDRAGQYSISVNGQWRICFRFDDGNAYDVEMTDYH